MRNIGKGYGRIRWMGLITLLLFAGGVAFLAGPAVPPAMAAATAEATVTPATPGATETPSASSPAVMAAEAIAASPRTVSIPVFAEDMVLTLPRNTTAFWFPVPGNARLSAAQIRLRLSASDTLIEERSTITLYLNGGQLSSAYIRDIAGNAGGLWTVDIPASEIRADGSLNELKFVTAQRSIEGDCADIDNPANWVKLLKESSLQLTVAEEGAPALSGVLGRFFDSLESTGALSAEFVLGKTPSEDAYAAMLKLAATMGGAYPYRDGVNVRVSGAEGRSDLTNKIYVGTGAQREAQGAFDAPDCAEAGAGCLAVAHSGGVNRLLVSGGDTEGLQKAAALMANRSLLALADTPSLTVTSAVPAVRKSETRKESGYYVLSDFGYDNVNLAGAFHQEASYSLRQPGGLQSGGNSYVQINFRHAEALISDNSLLTVYVNGVPLASAKLSASNAAGGSVKVRIPEEALAAETIRLKIQVYNYLGRLDCSKAYDDTAWTVIDKDSVVYLEPGEQAIPPTLTAFPAPSSEASETLVVLQSGASDAAYSLAAALAVRAGQAAGWTGEWRVAPMDALADPNPDADCLVLTDNEHATFPDALTSALAVVPEGGGKFAVSGNIGAVQELLADKIILQVARAPWNYDRRVYVVSYPEGKEEEALKFVQDRKMLDKLDGQTALVSDAGSVTGFTANAAGSSDNPPLTPERAVYLIETRTGYSIELLLAIVAALLLILILIVRTVRNKNRFQSAATSVRQKNADAAQPEDGEGENPRKK